MANDENKRVRRQAVLVLQAAGQEGAWETAAGGEQAAGAAEQGGGGGAQAGGQGGEGRQEAKAKGPSTDEFHCAPDLSSGDSNLKIAS